MMAYRCWCEWCEWICLCRYSSVCASLSEHATVYVTYCEINYFEIAFVGVAEASGGAEDGVVVAEAPAEEGDKDGKKPKKNRCHECRKKVGLTGWYHLR